MRHATSSNRRGVYEGLGVSGCAGGAGFFLVALITVFGAQGCDSNVCDGGDPPAISSASYDRSCSSDADCVAVPEGDVCTACALDCTQPGVVNTSAEAKYLSEVAALKSQYQPGACSCPAVYPPMVCCVGGACHNDQSCGHP